MFNPEKIKSKESQKETSKNLLLEGPKLISPEEEKQKEEISFSFYSNTRHYYFGYNKGKSFFIIEYFNALPKELTTTEKEKFIKEIRKQNKEEKIVYVLKYGELPEPKKSTKEVEKYKEYHIAQPRDFEKDALNRFVIDDKNKKILSEILSKYSGLKPEKTIQITEEIFDAYRKNNPDKIDSLANLFTKEILHKIRIEVRKKILPKPQEIQINQLAEILKNKKVLFYTGAGISIASGVYNMEQLQKNLGIEMSQKIDNFLKMAVQNPENAIKVWTKFIKTIFEKPTTPAHQSLSAIAQKLKSQIFTENVDLLQEKAGIEAIHINYSWLKENIQPEWLKNIDIIITIGLSYDDRGFLNWYKENNPNGKIIAINLNQPSYLGDEDFILKGDCQKILPALEKKLSL